MATLAAERTEVDIDVTPQNESAGRGHGEGPVGDTDVVVLDQAAGVDDLDTVQPADPDHPAEVDHPSAASDLDAAVEAPAAGGPGPDLGAPSGGIAEPDPAAAADPVTRELVIDDLLGDAEGDPVPLVAAVSVAGSPAATVAAVATVAATPPTTPGFVDAPLRSQVRAARRLQARKVGRLVRHIELYSLLKVSLLFYTCMLIVGVIAGVLLWSMLHKSGAVSSVEGFVGEIFLLENFHLEGRQIFRIGVLAGMVGVLVLTMVTLVGGLLFNLISDLTGGIRVSVVELESARPVPSRGRRH